jgi:ADP-ribosylglycohydrolase
LGQPRADSAARVALAQYQSAFTHGHATALAASDLTARAVTELLEGRHPTELAASLRDYAQSQRSVWHGDWLCNPLTAPRSHEPRTVIAQGWDECLQALDRLDAAIAQTDLLGDPRNATGAGWTAEEALTTGLLCFLLYPDRPVAAVRRAATTSGDSDSIACLTGAFAGATHGLDAWPADWRQWIEYRTDLVRLSAAFSS